MNQCRTTLLFQVATLTLTLALANVAGFGHKGDPTAPARSGNSTSSMTDTSTCKITSYVLALQHLCGFESIHGLWPDPEASCTSCTTEAFSTAKLSSSTLSGMKQYWPTCQSGSTDESFWSHEWSKHGTCSGMTQDAYFSEGLALFKSYSSKCNNKDCNLCFTPTFSYTGIC